MAKNIVANGFAKRCLVSVAYAIGKAEPLMVEAINERGQSIAELVRKHFDFRPSAIIERLQLRQPIFIQTAVYGHFGKSNLPWEETVSLKAELLAGNTTMTTHKQVLRPKEHV